MEGKMNALLKTAAEPDAMEYVEDFDIPQIKDDEVLMEIKAVGICGHRSLSLSLESRNRKFLSHPVSCNLRS